MTSGTLCCACLTATYAAICVPGRSTHHDANTTCYVQEEFFMEQSVDKAISIDEWTGEALSSSMVDDVFYILRMCSYRALDTANLQALTAVLGQLNTLLASNLAQALDQRWKVLLLSAMLACHFRSLCFLVRKLIPSAIRVS